MSDPPIQPSKQRMFVTLRKLGVADDEAYAFVQGTENMAGQNVNAEIRVQNAKIYAVLETRGAKIDAIQREINALRWTIILGFTGLAILITVLALLA